tara:strand:- start:105 stop:359 length:255 start_codon:yes stop_codon:yes gene_type:complete
MLPNGLISKCLTYRNPELTVVADSSGLTLQSPAATLPPIAGKLQVEHMVVLAALQIPSIAHGDIKSNSLAAHHAAEARQLRALV